MPDGVGMRQLNRRRALSGLGAVAAMTVFGSAHANVAGRKPGSLIWRMRTGQERAEQRGGLPLRGR
jgi:hypothetical protein